MPLREVQGAKLSVEELPGHMEGQYENTAVEYAMAFTKKPQPRAVLAAGNGSVQISGMDTMFSFETILGGGGGLDFVGKDYDGKPRASADRAAGVRRWQQEVRSPPDRVPRAALSRR